MAGPLWKNTHLVDEVDAYTGVEKALRNAQVHGFNSIIEVQSTHRLDHNARVHYSAVIGSYSPKHLFNRTGRRSAEVCTDFSEKICLMVHCRLSDLPLSERLFAEISLALDNVALFGRARDP